MTKKIFKSIMLTAGAVLLASLVLIMGCLYDYFDNVQEKQLRDELNLAAVSVESMGKDYLEKLEADRFRLTWVAADGTVIFDTQADASGMENHADRKEIKEALQIGTGESVRYSSTLLEQTVYAAKRINDGTVLRISVSRAALGVIVLGMFQPIIFVLIAALILSAVLANRISKRITGSLNNLDLDSPLENDTYEELSPLLSRLYQQQNSIARQMRQLERQRDEFAQITGSMREGLVLLNEKGIVVSINPTACKLFDTDRDCVGRDFLTVDRSRELSRAIESAMTEGHGEARVSRTGRCYQFDISSIESDGSRIGAVLLIFDVTEQEFAERNRREFTANVSHELKTPLQAIIGSAELLEKELVKPEDVPRFVGHIHHEAARLVSLIEDIIRLSQLDEGGEMPREKVELRGLADEVISDLQDTAHAKGVSLSVSGSNDEIVVNGVRRLLYETVYNLCDNAIRYNIEGGTVDVSVSSDDKNAHVTIKDSGIGIPEEHQSRIFERFYRVDKSHSKESGGTGLGLSIVKHAVAYHNGIITLNTQPGRGTEITVTLPIA